MSEILSAADVQSRLEDLCDVDGLNKAKKAREVYAVMETIAVQNAALRASNAALIERIALDNAVCLCGCPAKDHEDLGEDGEQCEHEDHECLRVAPAVLAAMQAERASNAALREALRHAARELQYILDADPCEQGVIHQSAEGYACVALAESLLGPMRDWPEEPNASARAAEASPSASDGGGGE